MGCVQRNQQHRWPKQPSTGPCRRRYVPACTETQAALQHRAKHSHTTSRAAAAAAAPPPRFSSAAAAGRPPSAGTAPQLKPSNAKQSSSCSRPPNSSSSGTAPTFPVHHPQLVVILHPQLCQALPLLLQHRGRPILEQVQPLVLRRLRQRACIGGRRVLPSWQQQRRRCGAWETATTPHATSEQRQWLQPACGSHSFHPAATFCSSSCSFCFRCATVSVGSTCRKTV